ncbi:nitroreductase family protein [Bosea sp. OK403]|uniref:nitroreductase family protein n=1 Tax=Bosea sp. OK403 TaxID=1855286 RepID=UPI001587EA92|nr:nitroreductase family protein [Bosea sp. OK403]
MAFSEQIWPVSYSLQLRDFVPPPIVDFASVLEARRSIGTLERAPFRELCNLVNFVCSDRKSWGKNLRRSWRTAPSAGALHPIEVLIVSTKGSHRIFRFNARLQTIELLRLHSVVLAADVLRQARTILPQATGDFIVLLADPAKTEAAYVHAQSLLWRDAGALMQTLQLAATAFRLSFCPIGATGCGLAPAIFGPDPRMRAVGMAAVGRPAA